ncbi:hypothetical protein Snoj_08070 [Streptomyces nojiriensis]|uniref:Uncharacterized protein n=1 Tax=Streptomyces nojiriensis TaxID=66374 RepID=A0ABQ3SFL4_9ACTN|nr:hypothetical protein [Streptomyces nojiriensis]QTI48531.1 hypothetical protein JYK04_06395 [Streptomyces nojiriensis]GGS03454.1 hypothetical protein GCM10010205_35420 [Streptomyces nojiriensis]GHI66889.1 hypothetical protein Snoj_08070 [Streptomyces nojiriensis]
MNRSPGTFVFDAPSLLAGLVQHGYRTVCVGGVTSTKCWLVIVWADHGHAFGADVYHGRGMAHPTVTTAPFACTVLGQRPTLGP